MNWLPILPLLCTIVVSCSCGGRTHIASNDAGPDEWRVKTRDGVSLFVREFGTGDTITVLHGGWGAEHSYLIDAFAPLANEHHIIFYDQRGSLRSRCPDSLISVDNHIDDVETIRKATGQRKLLLVAHSMGGFLAMSYITRYPDNVKGLILISSPPAQGDIEQLTEGLQGSALERWKRPEVVDTLKAHGLDVADWNTYTGKRSGTTHRITFAAINLHHVKNWRKVQGAFDWNASSAAMAAATGPRTWDFTGVLKEAGFPVTLLHGDDDYLPGSYHTAWVSGLPNVELMTVNAAGHLCWIDQPDAFHRLLRNALAKYRH